MRPAAPSLALATFALLALPAALSAQTAPRPARPPARAPAATNAAAQGNGIVAIVNGDVISRADIAARARLLALNVGLAAAPEQLQRLTPQVTRLLVDERLRNQEVRRRRIPVGDDDVAEAVKDIEKRNGLPEGGLVAQLRRSGVAPRALFDQLRSQIGWARLIRATLGGNAVEPTDAEVQEFLNANKARAGEPEYQVSEVFIPVENPAHEDEAKRFVDEVSRQLRSGTAFQVAATQFSQSQTALQGGDLGWVHKDRLDPEVAAVIERMPVGAISAPIRVPGGFQIVALRQKRETGRDIATILTLRQVLLPFATPLNPQAPTDQQRAQVERAQRISESARGCEAMDAAQRQAGGERGSDPGPVRLETVNPPALRQLLAGLAPGRASQPLLSNEGVMLFMVCNRESRNLAEVNAEQAKELMLRDRLESQSRLLLRDARRRAAIEMRDQG